MASKGFQIKNAEGVAISLNDPNPFDINKTYFKQASEDLKIAMMIPNSMF